MSGKSPGLESRLAAEIARSGPMPFDRFMAGALYDAKAGYYASGKAVIGRNGDYFTNVSLGPVFGEVLAGQFVEMWNALGQPADFTLIEQGAGDGQLARDILDALASTPLNGAPLVVIEPLEHLRAVQTAKLAGQNVTWVHDAAAVPELCGVHYSNELFDALPVHLVRSTGEGWTELHVDRENDHFVWRELPVAGELGDIVATFPVRPKGFTTEVCLAQREILHALAKKITRGFLLAVDYGMTQESLLAEHRTDGTLSCYSGHKRDANPLEFPGEKDITAHVNFSRLAVDAVRSGWQFVNSTDQHHFLVGAATSLLLSMEGCASDPADRKKIRSLRTLLHPESMGRQFHALLFSRGVGGVNLSGFQYAGKPTLEFAGG